MGLGVPEAIMLLKLDEGLLSVAVVTLCVWTRHSKFATRRISHPTILVFIIARVSQAIEISANELVFHDFSSILIEKWKLRICSMLDMRRRVRLLYNFSEGVHDDQPTDVKRSRHWVSKSGLGRHCDYS